MICVDPSSSCDLTPAADATAVPAAAPAAAAPSGRSASATATLLRHSVLNRLPFHTISHFSKLHRLELGGIFLCLTIGVCFGLSRPAFLLRPIGHLLGCHRRNGCRCLVFLCWPTAAASSPAPAAPTAVAATAAAGKATARSPRCRARSDSPASQRVSSSAHRTSFSSHRTSSITLVAISAARAFTASASCGSALGSLATRGSRGSATHRARSLGTCSRSSASSRCSWSRASSTQSRRSHAASVLSVSRSTASARLSMMKLSTSLSPGGGGSRGARK